MKTSYYRDAYGWVGLTLVELGDSRVLRILTQKRQLDGKLVTTATCLVRGEDDILTSTRGVDDFHLTVAARKLSRVIEGLVRAQHEAALSKLGEILVRLEQHEQQPTRQGT